MDLLSKVILELFSNNGETFDLERIRKTKFKFSLKDSYYGITTKSHETPKRQVVLNLTLEDAQASRTFAIDLTSRASEKQLTPDSDIAQVVYHEVGHALVNDPEITGETLEHLTVVAAGKAAGYAYYEQTGQKMLLRKQDGIAIIGRILGGNEGEAFAHLPQTQGWQDDLEKARNTAEMYVAKYGWADKPFELPSKNGKVDVEHPKVQKEIEKLLIAGQKYARETLNSKKEAFKLVSEYLLKHKTIDGETFRKLVASVPKNENCDTFLEDGSNKK